MRHSRVRAAAAAVALTGGVLSVALGADLASGDGGGATLPASVEHSNGRYEPARPLDADLSNGRYEPFRAVESTR